MITAYNTDVPAPPYPPEWDEPERVPCTVCAAEGYVAEMFMRDDGDYVCEWCAGGIAEMDQACDFDSH